MHRSYRQKTNAAECAYVHEIVHMLIQTLSVVVQHATRRHTVRATKAECYRGGEPTRLTHRRPAYDGDGYRVRTETPKANSQSVRSIVDAVQEVIP